MTDTNLKTLADRLTEGRIPITEALRYGMQLAETLRRMHDEGRTHGAVAPVHVALTGTSVELLSAPYGPAATAYAAPEVLESTPADARSDIFSFAAVLYEMLTGRAAFNGTDRTAPAPTGSPAVDRLMSSCLALEPAVRCQRMQKAMMDMKLLAGAAARAAAAPAARREPALADLLRAEIAQIEARINTRLQAQEKTSIDLVNAVTEALQQLPDQAAETRASMLQMETRMAARMQSADQKIAEVQRTATEALYRQPAETLATAAEVQQIEARVATRLEANEHAMAEMQRVAGEAVTTLRDQLGTIGSELTAAQERSLIAERNIEASGERLVARVQQSIDAVTSHIQELEEKVAALQSQAGHASDERIGRVEEGLEAVRAQVTGLHDLVAEDMLNFEKNLKVQAAAVDSARTAMAQTDDLVERVVEALEALQTTVLEHSDDRMMAAVN